MNKQDELRKTDSNLDPISGKPGAHPLGTGIGAALGGAAAGAATGTLAGPLGTLVGTAAGAIAGGLAGKGVAEALSPTTEAIDLGKQNALPDSVAPRTSNSGNAGLSWVRARHAARDAWHRVNR